MRKLFMTILLGSFLVLGVGTSSAQQQATTTFKLTNHGQFLILVKIFSQTRPWVWPGPNSQYNLDSFNTEFSIPISCQVGEKVCYGASYNANDQPGYWGVGFKGDESCTDCCLTCAPNAWHAWRLNDQPYECASCNDGACQCGKDTADNLCAGHGGVDPNLGCIQESLKLKPHPSAAADPYLLQQGRSLVPNLTMRAQRGEAAPAIAGTKGNVVPSMRSIEAPLKQLNK